MSKKRNLTALFLAVCMFTLFIGCNKTKEISASLDASLLNYEISELSDIQQDNLYKLCKVWGFLKYYHPAVAKGDYNWDNEFFKILPDILEAESSESADDVLSKLIESMGEIKTSDKSASIEESTIKMAPDIDWIKDSDFISDKLISLLDDVQRAKRSRSHHYLGFGGSGNPIFKNELEYKDLQYNQSPYMLLSLFRYWNMVEYFFPYKYLMDEDWNDVLKEYVPKIIECKTAESYHLAINQITGKINDGHAPSPYSDNWSLYMLVGSKKLPINLHLVEGETVITEIHPSISTSTILKLGDVVTKIDGVDIKTKRDELEQYLKPTSNVHPNFRMNTFLSYSKKDSTEITVQRNGESITETLNAISKEKNKEWTERKSHELLNGNIGYIYPEALKKKEIKSIMKKFMDTDGLIVDLRCYPSEFIVFSLGNYLVHNPTEFVKFTRGSLRNPGTFTLTKPLKVGSPLSKKYKGKVVVLINEDSMSQPEYTAMAFRASPNVTVVGDNTMGADGNISHIILPGGVSTIFTGIGIYYPDGEETQRIGIIPDIYVKPTIEGIQAGHDEQLEKAIELLK